MTNNKNNYFIYARKSSEDKDKQIQSIPDQLKILKEVAFCKNINVIDIFTEEKSAKKPYNRPIFEKMLSKIENGEAANLLVWDITRLSRNPIDSGRIHWMLQQGKIQNITTPSRDYKTGENVLLIGIESSMANQFIIDLRKNTLRGLMGKIDRGWFPSRPPQGYINDTINKIIAPDPERFELIKKMWDMLLTGNYNPSKIRSIANEEWGYRTIQHKKRGGRKISRSGIYRLFQNHFYYGAFIYNGKLHKGNHQPMITVEQFNKAQEIIGSQNKPKPKNHTFAFTGIIRCAECGCLITAEEKKKYIKNKNQYRHYIYYHCTHRKNEINCNQSSINLNDLENQITQEIEKYTISPEFKDYAIEVIKENHNQEIQQRSKSYNMLNGTYNKLQKELDNLTDMRIRDLISDDEFVNKRKFIQHQITNTRIQLDSNQDRGQNWIDQVDKALNFITHAKEIFSNTEDKQLKREILTTLGQMFTLKNKQIYIEPIDWLVPISNLKKFEGDFKKMLEPAKNTLKIDKNSHKLAVCPIKGD